MKVWAPHSQRPPTGSSSWSEHELRLHELHKLSLRQQATEPGPGHYQVVVEAFQHRGARRPQQQHLDGPFHLQQGQASTRAHQLDSCLLLRDSGLGPAAYDSSSSVKATSPRAATPKVGTARRGAPSYASSPSSSLGPSQVCVSLSRSLAAGLDWRQQLTLAQVQQHLAATHAQWTTARLPSALPPPAAAAGHHLGPPPAAAAGSCSRTLQQQQDLVRQHEHTQEQHEQGQQVREQAQQQQQQPSQEWDPLIEHQQQQGQPAGHPGQQQFTSSSTSSGSGSCCAGQAKRMHSAGGSMSSSSRPCKALPWQLAASLAHHEQLIQPLKDAHLAQQQQPALTEPLDTGVPEQQQHQQQQAPGQQGGMVQQQQLQQLQTYCRRPPSQPVVVMQQQEVLQHRSAARAATAAHHTADRRRLWQQLSGLRPPPYPVFLPDAAGSRAGGGAARAHSASGTDT